MLLSDCLQQLAASVLFTLSISGFVGAQQSTGSQGCTWQYIACLADNADSLLKGVTPAIQSSDMTVGKCQSFCTQLGYTFAGLEHGQYCFCDNRFSYVAQVSHSCNELCAGNSSETCGGLWTLSLFRCAEPKMGPPGLNNCKWQHQGCYQDSTERRLIPEIEWKEDHMTVDNCQTFCYRSKYPFAGVEDGNYCYCGYDFLYPPQKVISCSKVCPGNTNQLCGGAYSINAYKCVSPNAPAVNTTRMTTPQTTVQTTFATNPTTIEPTQPVTTNPDLLSHSEWSDGDRVDSLPWGNQPMSERFVVPDDHPQANENTQDPKDSSEQGEPQGDVVDTHGDQGDPSDTEKMDNHRYHDDENNRRRRRGLWQLRY